jgi:hypothetical protein
MAQDWDSTGAAAEHSILIPQCLRCQDAWMGPGKALLKEKCFLSFLASLLQFVLGFFSVSKNNQN